MDTTAYINSGPEPFRDAIEGEIIKIHRMSGLFLFQGLKRFKVVGRSPTLAWLRSGYAQLGLELRGIKDSILVKVK